MLPLLAVPVAHSAGGWIASTAAGGYLAGTLSTTWVGALVAGNSTLFTVLGLVSVDAVALGLAGSVSGGLTSAAAAVGLVSTTPAWVVPAAVTAGVSVVGVTAYVAYNLKNLNKERVKGGLEPLTTKEVLAEVKAYFKKEKDSE